MRYVIFLCASPSSDAAVQELAARPAPAWGQPQLPHAPPPSSRLSSTDASSLRTIDTRTAFSSSMSTASLHTVTSPSSHKRSMTIYKGNSVSTVLITSAIETIAASCEAKRSAPLRESVHIALEMVRAAMGGDRPREIFEPLRLACETRNEKLMVASLDCISKLISYSFFVEANPPEHASLPSPPPSPGPGARHSTSSASQSNLSPPSLVDLVVHTITTCHTETTADSVSLQVVKALLALVLSSTILVHQSSLLKAVRTVYNVFLMSTDPVNQTVAQGGLTQMVHHIFSRCTVAPPAAAESTTSLASKAEESPSAKRDSFAPSTPDTEPPRPLPSQDEAPSAEDISLEIPLPLSPPVAPHDDSPVLELPPTNGIQHDLDRPGTPHAWVSPAQSRLCSFLTDPHVSEPTLRPSTPGRAHYAAPAHAMTINDLFLKDAFLVFRSMCKLTMKPLNTERFALLSSHHIILY